MKLVISKDAIGFWTWQFVEKLEGQPVAMAQSFGGFDTRKEAEDNCYENVGDMVRVLIKKGKASERRILRDWF